MKHLNTSAIALMALVLCWGVGTTSLAGDTIIYDGILSDGAGQAVADAAYDFELALYDTATAGNQIWRESHPGVKVHDGHYSLTLGSVTPIELPGGGYWLQITIAGEVLEPRTELTLTGAVAGSARAKRSNCTVDGWLAVNGGVTANSTASSAWGVAASGPTGGARFAHSSGDGFAELGRANEGIRAYGSAEGAFFADDSILASGYASLGRPNYGIRAYGVSAGGTFEDINGTSVANVGSGGWGIWALGDTGGGHFADRSTSPTGYADVGTPNHGIEARGAWVGGAFYDSNGNGFAEVGRGNEGIRAYGSDGGGYFADSNTSPTTAAQVGGPNWGVDAFGTSGGGYFANAESGPTSAMVAASWNGYGVSAQGIAGGGEFFAQGTANWSDVANTTYKVQGPGTCAFVQNHPYQREQVVVYAAPEGDEVATYTRGTARLVNGEAHVALGETFEWVTNPDLGLTAHLTPRGEAVPLAVVSLSTTELVVSGPADVAFDYLVHGLRIGFEEVSIVQEKQKEAWIPAMTSHRQRYAADPGLQRYNALERFKGMEARLRGLAPDDIDLSRAEALRDAIHEFDPEVDSSAAAGGPAPRE